MLMKIKQLLCLHDYKPKKLYYRSIIKYGTLSFPTIYVIYLFEYSKCSKCGKEHIAKLETFSNLIQEDANKIQQLLENHKAISYFQFLEERIKENG